MTPTRPRKAPAFRSTIAILLCCGAAGAQGSVFFGEDLNTSDDPWTPADDPSPLAATPLVDAAGSAFQAAIGNLATESFESFAAGALPPLTLQYGASTAVLDGTNGVVMEQAAGTFNGTYPTHGAKFYIQTIGASNTFKIDFSPSQVALAFKATDVGDGGGQLKLTLDLAGGGTVTHLVPSTAGPANSGSMLFFGVIDALHPFHQVTFENSNPTVDGFGFDEMRIVQYADVCPDMFPPDVKVRLGDPPNPLALLPGPGGSPVVGSIWDPLIEHTSFVPGAVVDLLGIAITPINLPLPPHGTLLCDVISFAPVVLASAPGVPFQAPVPAQCNLAGVSLCSQGASVDQLGNALLTNALDITIGAY